MKVKVKSKFEVNKQPELQYNSQSTEQHEQQI